MSGYTPGKDWTVDLLRASERLATLETPRERANEILKALVAAEGRGAKLAAAPEMLEALRKTVEVAEACDIPCHPERCGVEGTPHAHLKHQAWTCEAIREARALIAKATAGSPALGEMSFDPRATGGAR